MRKRCTTLVLVLVFGSTARAGETPSATPPPSVSIPTPAEAAQLVEPVLPPEPVVLRHSPGWAAIHVLGVNVGFSIIGLTLLQKDYLKISPRTIWNNVSGSWAWDDDAFTTNQFGHPYFGNLAFNAARSNGIGFWGSALASFAGSLLWEVVMETATPSINDQFFTPAGGVILGESLFRLGEVVRWRDRSFASRALAAAVDPMGAISRWTHGDAYVLAEPPPRFGFLSLGWNGLSVDLGAPAGERFEGATSRLHGAIYQSYGIPIDSRFQPRRPLDHFDLLIEGNYNEDEASLSLHTRGMLWGRAAHLERGGAIGGIMASYDFVNLSPTRISAVSVGLGGVLHHPIGDARFMQVSLNAGLIPYGAAGYDVLADRDVESSHSSYHRGPGGQALVDLRVGWRGRGLAYLNGRGYYINGNFFDEGSEYVSHVRLGMIVGIFEPHAIQVEGVLASRRARFGIGSPRDVQDSTAQLIISYTFVSDFEFGGGPATPAPTK